MCVRGEGGGGGGRGAALGTSAWSCFGELSRKSRLSSVSFPAILWWQGTSFLFLCNFSVTTPDHCYDSRIKGAGIAVVHGRKGVRHVHISAPCSHPERGCRYDTLCIISRRCLILKRCRWGMTPPFFSLVIDHGHTKLEWGKYKVGIL